MFDEILVFFKEHGNGIMYLMFFFIIILTILSYYNSSTAIITPASSALNSVSVISKYANNIFYSLSVIIILLFIFSLIGYNFSLSSSSSPSSSSSSSSSSSLSELYLFFSENGITILNVVLTFFMLIVLFSMLGIDFNKSKNKSIKKIVEIESFTCNNDNPTLNETQCNTLSEDNCISTTCCGWLNGEKCVSSDAYHKNPNYYSDDASNKIQISTWCTSNGCK